MKFGKSFLVVFFLGMVMFCGTLSVKADESLVMRPMEKLGRVITNVAFCALELPMKWSDVSSEHWQVLPMVRSEVSAMWLPVHASVLSILPLFFSRCPIVLMIRKMSAGVTVRS